MTRTSLTLLAALAAMAPLGSAFAADAQGGLVQDGPRFERAARIDLKHASADLATTWRTPDGPARPDGAAMQRVAVPPGHAGVMAARNWVERAETELLNRASYKADGALTQGQPIASDAAIATTIAARTDLTKGDIRDARTAIRHGLHDLQPVQPRA